MGICESNANTVTKKEANEGIDQKEEEEEVTENQNHSINMNQARLNEAIIKDFPNPFTELNPKTSKILSKQICRILL